MKLKHRKHRWRHVEHHTHHKQRKELDNDTYLHISVMEINLGKHTFKYGTFVFIIKLYTGDSFVLQSVIFSFDVLCSNLAETILERLKQLPLSLQAVCVFYYSVPGPSLYLCLTNCFVFAQNNNLSGPVIKVVTCK